MFLFNNGDKSRCSSLINIPVLNIDFQVNTPFLHDRLAHSNIYLLPSASLWLCKFRLVNINFFYLFNFSLVLLLPFCSRFYFSSCHFPLQSSLCNWILSQADCVYNTDYHLFLCHTSDNASLFDKPIKLQLEIQRKISCLAFMNNSELLLK